jgi:hypothetical protein
VKDQFFSFNEENPYNDKTHIIDRAGHVVHGPHFGLSLRDGLDLPRVSLTPESALDGPCIEDFFTFRVRILFDRILAFVVDDQGLAPPAQRDRVPALHESLHLSISSPFDDDRRHA